MKRLKFIAGILFCLGPCFNAAAQELKVGDKVPAILLTKLIGAQRRSVQVADLYQHGLLIIDFWATWCVPCIRELKIADSLAAKHSRLRFLSVSVDDSLKAATFLDKHPEIGTRHVIVTADNELLNRYFKHTTIPHNVWIDRKGVVRLISEGDSVNDKNILILLKPE